MDVLEFPEEAKSLFLGIDQRFSENPGYVAALKECERALFTPGSDFSQIQREWNPISESLACSALSVETYFFLRCLEELYVRYENAGISEKIFWDTAADLRFKLSECHAVHGIWGTFVGSWNPPFYRMERFALGRFQYERTPFPSDGYEKKGAIIEKGEPVLNFHIPSSGRMPKEVRLDSYREAYRFYGTSRKDGLLVLICDSWLLYPNHRSILPESSNILSFMDDFEIISSREADNFPDQWRVFGNTEGLSPSDLPEKTSLQRAFKSYLLSGGKMGSGFGVILFDGEKIVG